MTAAALSQNLGGHRDQRAAQRAVARQVLLLCYSFVCGFIWLSYFLGIPIMNQQAPLFGAQVHRALKFFLPLGLIVFANHQLPRTLIKRWDGMLLASVFFFFPAVAFFTAPLENFFIYGVIPVFAAGILLVTLLSLSERDFLTVLLGIGCAAAVVFSYCFLQYGFTADNYYYRQRSHFGLRHPLIVCSTVIACTMGFYVALFKAQRMTMTRNLRWLVYGTVHLIVGALFLAADSRNMDLAFVMFTFTFIGAHFLRNRPKMLKSIVIVVTISPLVIYAAAFVINAYQGPLPLAYRRFQEFAGAIDDALFTQVHPGILGPSWIQIKNFAVGIARFSLADSVFLSYMSLFGAVSITPLMVFMGRIGWHQTQEASPLGLALWAAVMTIYCFDSQGFTFANPVVFLLLAYLVRKVFCHGQVP